MRTDNKSTPGPWIAYDGSITATFRRERVQVASMMRTSWGGKEHHKNAAFRAMEEADAALIASAPDMAIEIERLKAEKAELVRALQACVKDLAMWPGPEFFPSVKTARAILAKTGGAL